MIQCIQAHIVGQYLFSNHIFELHDWHFNLTIIKNFKHYNFVSGLYQNMYPSAIDHFLLNTS